MKLLIFNKVITFFATIYRIKKSICIKYLNVNWSGMLTTSLNKVTFGFARLGSKTKGDVVKSENFKSMQLIKSGKRYAMGNVYLKNRNEKPEFLWLELTEI